MSLIGEVITVVASTDPTKVGRSGTVLIETSKTLVMTCGNRRVRVEKQGAAFLTKRNKEVASGNDMVGRPEDYLGGRRK